MSLFTPPIPQENELPRFLGVDLWVGLGEIGGELAGNLFNLIKQKANSRQNSLFI